MARTKVAVHGVVLGLVASVLVALLAQPAQARDNTSTVCQQTAATLEAGLQTFVGQLQHVSGQASSGDLVGANATVQQAGATLKSMAAQVRQQNNADNQQLRSLLEQLATQLDSLGAQLSDLTGLQNFNLGPIEQTGTQISNICGPGASFPAPSGSVLPSRTS
jgi:gas vesicle protein